jgi:hypothetical protein
VASIASEFNSTTPIVMFSNFLCAPDGTLTPKTLELRKEAVPSRFLGRLQPCEIPRWWTRSALPAYDRASNDRFAGTCWLSSHGWKPAEYVRFGQVLASW